MGKAEDVIDKEQHVLTLFVAKVFRQGQAGQANPGAGAGRFVHLAKHQRRLGIAILFDHPRFQHFVVKVVPLAGSFTNSGKNRIAAVALGNVVDQLHDNNRFANPGAAKQADFTALGVRRQQVHHLDAGHQDFLVGRLVDKLRGRRMYRGFLLGLDRAHFINRFTDNVHNPAKRLRPDRDGYRGAGIGYLGPADQSFGGIHGNRANRVFAQVQGHFQNQTVALVGGLQRRQDRRQVAFKVNIHHGRDDLCNGANVFAFSHSFNTP